ncbi:uncharacterized protein LOC117192603 [Drosophila miranda]|uniref:uncharacterized protein LOC117192603 n=1 Tax=Drosophila miranda TaxID=7229 RepID=UPI00143FB283|nr:uncharacterized protein LOC117192603 [Drosophila miranda]
MCIDIIFVLSVTIQRQSIRKRTFWIGSQGLPLQFGDPSAAEMTIDRRRKCSFTPTPESNADLQLRNEGLVYPTVCHKDRTESYLSITEAHSRHTESCPSQTDSYTSRTEAHPSEDPKLRSHRHPSIWPSTINTLREGLRGLLDR